MTNVRSWQFWVIVALALGTMACAGKRERREEARAERAERNEQKKAERAERNEQKRAQREGRSAEAPASPPRAQSAAPAAVFTPISTAPTAAVAESKVVFMRPHAYGGAIQASVFDVTGRGDAKFIGIITYNTQLSYPVRPGRYTFMVVGESADFMEAEVDAGKSYYALVIARPGAWKARFSFVPVRQSEKRVEKWESSLRPVVNTPRSTAWASQNAPSIENKRSRYYVEWSSKPESQRAGQTLNADDGR